MKSISVNWAASSGYKNAYKVNMGERDASLKTNK